MKKIFLAVLIFVSFLEGIHAQDIMFKHKIAVFTPLFLDSAFRADTEYVFEKNYFPKFLNPGLEFYEGVQLALDSLSKMKIPVEVFVYDTRSTTETLAEQLARPEMDSMELIIAHCNPAEVKTFAQAGFEKNIPIINVNLPNDGNETANPFFVLLNPTLRTQCEGIYAYMQKHHSPGRIVVFRKKGPLEDRIKMYWDDGGKMVKTNPLHLKYAELTDSFTVNQLKQYLDTTYQTLCVAGSLDENFGKRLALQLAVLKKQKYPVTIMGMPTWDNIKEFSKPEYKGIEIVYSTPFYSPRSDSVSQGIINYFNTTMFARPSDMVFRGYEVTWKYAMLLLHCGKDVASSLTLKQPKLFTDFDIQPVINRQTLTLDYFENKKLYFLKWEDGLLKAVY